MTRYFTHPTRTLEMLRDRCATFGPITLILGYGLLAQFPAFATTVATLPPRDLLSALPPAPVDWTCLESIGKMRFSVVDTAQTSVIRQYKVPPPKVEPPPAVPPLPGTLTLSVFDLGSLGNPHDNPPITIKTDDLFPLSPFTGSSFQMLRNKDLFFSGTIGSRLLVQITARDILPDNFKKILKTLDFTPLVAAENQLPNTILKEEVVSGPAPVISTSPILKLGVAHKFKSTKLETLYVDELHPQFNRSTVATRLQPLP